MRKALNFAALIGDQIILFDPKNDRGYKVKKV
jgi:hypothetical protein